MTVALAALIALAVVSVAGIALSLVLFARADQRLQHEHARNEARICEVERADRAADEQLAARMRLRLTFPPVPGC